MHLGIAQIAVWPPALNRALNRKLWGPFFRTYLRKFVCGVNFWAISAPGKFGLQKETSFSRFVSGGLP